MRRTMTDFSESEKAQMMDNIIDEVIQSYEEKKVPKDYKSRAEMVGYRILVVLHDNGFITSEGILGK